MAYKMKGPSLYRNSPLKSNGSWGSRIFGGQGALAAFGQNNQNNPGNFSAEGGVKNWIETARERARVNSQGLGKDPKVTSEGGNFVENRITKLENKINDK